MVRQMQPTAQGIPLEIYCFTRTTSWIDYERIQGDVFDYLLAVMPEFGLGAYQQPAARTCARACRACSNGRDRRRVRSSAGRRAAATKPPFDCEKGGPAMKPQLIYYVATSLDGFIARPDGSVDWLDRFAGGGSDHGYAPSTRGIDGLLMGRGSYDVVRGFGDWPYPGKPCQVLTRNPRVSGLGGSNCAMPRPRTACRALANRAAGGSGWPAAAAWPAVAWAPGCSTR
ncbi:dihydrofolate reductase [Pseudomonas aeruginosa]|nr:dihydrofolate reductase [Pseudomonas aeruginosa]